MKAQRKCPACGARALKKKGKNGEFWGCCRWPSCNGHLLDGDFSSEFKSNEEMDEDLDLFDALFGGVTFGDQD